jgi:hypothetical protein
MTTSNDADRLFPTDFNQFLMYTGKAYNIRATAMLRLSTFPHCYNASQRYRSKFHWNRPRGRILR